MVRTPAEQRPFRLSLYVILLGLLMVIVGFAFGSCSSKTVAEDPPLGTDDPRILRFSDATKEAGVDFEHVLPSTPSPAVRRSGGVAAGDYDRDGWVDLYVVQGNRLPNLLFRNRGGGTFEELAVQARVALPGEMSCGPLMVDFTGDGFVDIFLGGVDGTKPRLLKNMGNGRFQDVTAGSGLDTVEVDTFSAAFGDYDRDGDLDAFLTHWGVGRQRRATTQSLWRNNGDGTFTDVSIESGVADAILGNGTRERDDTLTPNFADMNDDGWPDILMTSDFGHSQMLVNEKDGSFSQTSQTSHRGVFSDDSGGGAAIGDHNNDRRLDWFVSGVHDPKFFAGQVRAGSGNRLYQNGVGGLLEDATDATGVRRGSWGWGSSFADFDNDGHLDLLQVNGYDSGDPSDGFADDPAMLFMADGKGAFIERAGELGLVDNGRGRGVVVFDYDRDGDLDVFITNSNGPARLFRNEGGNTANYLRIRLLGSGANTQAIGARIMVTVDGFTQLREIRAGSNFLSNNPAMAHFGLGKFERVDEIRIQWPEGKLVFHQDVAANQNLTYSQR